MCFTGAQHVREREGARCPSSATFQHTACAGCVMELRNAEVAWREHSGGGGQEESPANLPRSFVPTVVVEGRRSRLGWSGFTARALRPCRRRCPLSHCALARYWLLHRVGQAKCALRAGRAGSSGVLAECSQMLAPWLASTYMLLRILSRFWHSARPTKVAQSRPRNMDPKSGLMLRACGFRGSGAQVDLVWKTWVAQERGPGRHELVVSVGVEAHLARIRVRHVE